MSEPRSGWTVLLKHRCSPLYLSASALLCMIQFLWREGRRWPYDSSCGRVIKATSASGHNQIIIPSRTTLPPIWHCHPPHPHPRTYPHWHHAFKAVFWRTGLVFICQSIFDISNSSLTSYFYLVNTYSFREWRDDTKTWQYVFSCLTSSTSVFRYVDFFCQLFIVVLGCLLGAEYHLPSFQLLGRR